MTTKLYSGQHFEKRLKADQFEKRRIEQAKKAAELAEMEAATRAKIAAQKRESTQE